MIYSSSSKSVGRLKERLAELRMLTQHYARLFALAVIDEGDYREKCQSAALLLEIFHAARTMEHWAGQQFHSSSPAICWQDRYNPTHLNVLVDGRLDPDLLGKLLGEIWAQMCAVQADLLDFCLASRQFLHWAPIVDKLISNCPPSSAPFSSFQYAEASSSIDRFPGRPTKKIVGPNISRLDPIFSAEYSLQEFIAPLRADRIEVIVPYFWTLSVREAMVCDSCLLSAVEYDGLPLQFYEDMARQAADEARHAVMYLDLAIELMPAYLECQQRDAQTANRITKFLAGKGRLPVPKEGNLFPCMWHASLEERLIIMQVSTEGAAVASTRQAIDSSLAQIFPSIKRAFEIDYFDEVAHTRIGTRWLRYLCPDATQRKAAIENAKLLRGILLLTCFVPNNECNLADMAHRFEADHIMGSHEFFASS
jgi:hypothetical protein